MREVTAGLSESEERQTRATSCQSRTRTVPAKINKRLPISRDPPSGLPPKHLILCRTCIPNRSILYSAPRAVLLLVLLVHHKLYSLVSVVVGACV
jgi:hypothetical protein